MFDFDGPLALCVEKEFFSWANNQPTVKTPWRYEVLIQTGDWAEATGVSLLETTKLFQEFMQTSDYPGLLPTPGAALAMTAVPTGCRYLATARGHALSEVTRQFILEHFGPFHDYHFNVRDNKVTLTKKIAPDFVIDDCYPLLQRIAHETSAVAILFPKPTKRQVSNKSGVVILDAESFSSPDASHVNYSQRCSDAWQQITELLSASW
jgi:hypothetical protein